MRMKKCAMCPRRCGADRQNGQCGYCGVTDDFKVARAALHMWEEPCISGKNGSGTVFFSGCNLGCCYCQNIAISRGQSGKDISPERLTEILFELKHQGAHNINLVTPTQYALQLVSVLERVKKDGLDLPVVYNCGGYESVETLKQLDGLVDVYMPDFKYWSNLLAMRYSNAPDYRAVAQAAVAEMVRQRGKCMFDAEDMMQSGVLVRHMVLPGAAADAKKILAYLHDTYGDGIYISIMSQYTPVGTPKYAVLAEKVSQEEYDSVLDYAWHLGIKNAFVQEGESAKESFIPAFDNTGV